MTYILNEKGKSVISLSRVNADDDFISCNIFVSFQKDDYSYIPKFDVSVCLDFLRSAVLSFIEELTHLYSFEAQECVISDVEKSFILRFIMKKETGHISCECRIGNGSYGSLSFCFSLDQTMIPELESGLRGLI